MTEPHGKVDGRFSEEGAGPTTWAEAHRLINDAGLFWLSTVRTDGRPHVAPLVSVWVDDAPHFCTGPAEQKARNLEANTRCALTTGVNTWEEGLDVVVEGEAQRITDEGALQRIADAYEAKYGSDWHFDLVDGGFSSGEAGLALVFRIRPSKVLAFAKGPHSQTRFDLGEGRNP